MNQQVDDDALAEVASGGPFTVVNAHAFQSAVSGWVRLWVTPAGATAYEQVRPDQQGSHAQVPPGTLIIRQVTDANGTLEKTTLMMKGPPGYNPDLGDWWFGVLGPDGAPQQMGKLTDCYSCHLQRASDDYLFGVALGDRS